VFLHGCSGLGNSGKPFSSYLAWEEILKQQGYAVLMVDSAGSRGFGSTCGGGEGRKTMYRERPGDAYAALSYLQSRPEIDPVRVFLIGWSQGGGIVLLTVSSKSIGRLDPAPGHDFRAAIAFYPAACSKRLQTVPFTEVEPDAWSTVAPLLILQGEADNWTLAGPCVTFVESVQARGEPVEIVVYPDAVHSFDAPDMPVHERAGGRTSSGKPPLVGTHPEAREDAIARVIAFLNSHNADQ
jgi:dienelactone hydrolase